MGERMTKMFPMMKKSKKSIFIRNPAATGSLPSSEVPSGAPPFRRLLLFRTCLFSQIRYFGLKSISHNSKELRGQGDKGAAFGDKIKVTKQSTLLIFDLSRVLEVQSLCFKLVSKCCLPKTTFSSHL